MPLPQKVARHHEKDASLALTWTFVSRYRFRKLWPANLVTAATGSIRPEADPLDTISKPACSGVPIDMRRVNLAIKLDADRGNFRTPRAHQDLGRGAQHDLNSPKRRLRSRSSA